MSTDTLSLYFHFPFCESLCYYDGFHFLDFQFFQHFHLLPRTWVAKRSIRPPSRISRRTVSCRSHPSSNCASEPLRHALYKKICVLKTDSRNWELKNQKTTHQAPLPISWRDHSP